MATLSAYYHAVRAFSFPASVVPALLGVSASSIIHRDDAQFSFSLIHAILTLAGCIAIHSVSNLANDYFDYKSGLDSAENFGMKNPLVNGSLSVRELLGEIILLFTIALSIGVYFVIVVGLPILWLVMFGTLSAFGYTMPPLKLKYRGLGDIQVAVSFGMLMCFGAYLVQAHSCMTLHSAIAVIILALPQCLHIIAILHANNHRDRVSDSRHGVRTLASRLTNSQSIRFQYIMVYGSYGVLIVVWIASLMNIIDALPVTVLLPLLSLPLAFRVATNITRSEMPGTPAYKLLVAQAARLQLVSGLFLIIGLLLSLRL
ncbi:MAG: prenyltransferase [Candidatus Kapabacteria bacterium]|nr:prenyltransferase [Candidatus Kapabacteria bacterium]